MDHKDKFTIYWYLFFMHNEHAQLLSGPSDLVFGLDVHQFPYYQFTLTILCGYAGIA